MRRRIAAGLGALMVAAPIASAATPPLSLSNAHRAAARYERAYWHGKAGPIIVRPCHWYRWHGWKARCRVDAPRMPVFTGQPPLHVVWHDIVGLRRGQARVVASSMG